MMKVRLASLVSGGVWCSMYIMCCFLPAVLTVGFELPEYSVEAGKSIEVCLMTSDIPQNMFLAQPVQVRVNSGDPNGLGKATSL